MAILVPLAKRHRIVSRFSRRMLLSPPNPGDLEVRHRAAATTVTRKALVWHNARHTGQRAGRLVVRQSWQGGVLLGHKPPETHAWRDELPSLARKGESGEDARLVRRRVQLLACRKGEPWRLRLGPAQGVGGSVARGLSLVATRPCRFQPVRNSHVEGGSTASFESGGPDEGWAIHPVNADAEEQGSTPLAPGTCFFQFIST
jgi:hypothetical protein